jgi:hypothetical protein
MALFLLLIIKMKTIMKRLLTIIVIILMSLSLTAQIRNNKPYFDCNEVWSNSNSKLGIGVLGGMNRIDADFGLKDNSWLIGVQAKYDVLRFINIGVDYSIGNLKAGPLYLGTFEGKDFIAEFSNNYYTFSGVARILPFRVFMWDQMDPVVEYFTYPYIGFGVGMIRSNVTASPLELKEFGYKVKYKGTDQFTFLEFGWDFPIVKDQNERNKLMLNVNFRRMFTPSDYLDGYNPTVEANKHNDVYSTYTVGLTYKF